MHQWYAHLLAAFPDAPVGLLGGGAHDCTPLLVATYDSAAIYAEVLGTQYALLVFDECHHPPGTFTRVIAEYSLAPHRLGLTATPERADGTRADRICRKFSFASDMGYDLPLRPRVRSGGERSW
jgi:superfamily II DNA or RNA helicase